MIGAPPRTPVEETHKATLELGPGVVNGRLVWTSASGLTTIDTESTGGCPRRWWFEQVLRYRQPSTAAQKRGTKLHAEIEDLQNHGKPLLSPLALAGRHLIDEPGPGLLIEHALATRQPDGTLSGWLGAAGVLVAGHVDLWNHRGSYLNREGELVRDPPNTLETKDWKTTSDLKYAKTSAELARNVQLVTYAEAGFRAWSHLEHARLTHVYFRTRGAPVAEHRSVLCDREHIARGWEYIEGLARLASDVARETDQNKVPAVAKACDAYGGCPHRRYCTVGDSTSLSDVFGDRSAEILLARMRGEPLPKDQTVSLIDKMSPAVQAQYAQQIAPGVQTLTPPAGVGVQANLTPAIDAEMARLQAEEAQRRAMSAAGIPPGFGAALDSIRSSGWGTPAFVGRAAAAVAAHLGMALPPGAGISGSGVLAERVKQPVEDPAVLLALAAEIATMAPPAAVAIPQAVMPPPPPAPPVAIPAPVQAVPAPQPQAISVLPPDAPASNPAIAAQPVEGLDNAKARELAALTTPTLTAPLQATAAHVAATGALPPAAPPAPVSLLAPQPAAPPATVTPPEATPPQATAKPAGKKRGRPRKEAATAADGTAVELNTDDTINVYVNAIPSGEFSRLEPYIELACQTLCTEYGAADIQCAPKDGPLGYTKWKGALAALVRANPPKPGHYVVKYTSGESPAAIVVDALRTTIDNSGGQLVEGVAW